MQPMHTIPARGGLNYDESPFLAIWEITQSCDLACKHCRAAAQPLAHPDELTTAEGKRLIDQIAAMHIPIFVFTGGDPLKRKDVFELIRYAAGQGVRVAVTPSATPLLTREAIFQFKEAGLVRLGISLDGSTAEIHDAFRGLSGTYARTIQAIEWANEAGIPIQVHTTISRHNAKDLDNLCALFEKLAIVMWNVFFLVPVGRGSWFETPLCRGLLRRGRGFGSPAVFSVGVVSGACGFGEDRDDFQNARLARIAVNHDHRAVLKGGCAEWLCAGTHGHVLCARKRYIGRQCS